MPNVQRKFTLSRKNLTRDVAYFCDILPLENGLRVCLKRRDHLPSLEPQCRKTGSFSAFGLNRIWCKKKIFFAVTLFSLAPPFAHSNLIFVSGSLEGKRKESLFWDVTAQSASTCNPCSNRPVLSYTSQFSCALFHVSLSRKSFMTFVKLSKYAYISRCGRGRETSNKVIQIKRRR